MSEVKIGVLDKDWLKRSIGHAWASSFVDSLAAHLRVVVLDEEQLRRVVREALYDFRGDNVTIKQAVDAIVAAVKGEGK